MEFVPGGDLGSLVNQHGYLPEPDVKDMASQLLGALGYLHSQGVTHRDVKPDNILISSRSPLQVKLTDFGLSKVVDSEETFLRTFCGTLLYCAPEVYTEYREFDNNGRRTQRKKKPSSDAARYGHAVDVWSLAGVLFFALCGSPPYPTSNGATYITLLHRVMTEPLDIRPLQYVNVSEPGIRFIRHMLHVRPEYRATIEELQRSSWLLGGDSMEMSMDEDSSELEQGASQLSLQETDIEQGASQLSLVDDRQINDSEEFDHSVSDITEIQQREIPSSFSDGNSNGASYDYNYINGHQNLANNGNGRLFGEIDMSVGSSGAIPMDPQLNLPLPSANNHNQNIHLTFGDSASKFNSIDGSEDEFDPSQIDRASQQAGVIPSTEAATTMAPPAQRPSGPNFKAPGFQRRLQQDLPERASSLMGTESMVGQLNMHSPASAASPGAESPLPETAQEMVATSLRRPREEDVEGEEDWQPADLPAKRRRRSEREIDIPVPPSIFWDPADKSTHHNNYPPMFTSDYKNYKDWAKSKGEAFEQGHKSFDNTMQSFRASRSRSSSFAEPDRAQTEPAANEVRHMLMKRDERTLGETEIHTPSRASDEDFIPPTARASYATSPRSDVFNLNRRERSPSPILGSGFHPPKRILAKFVSTPDSCITNINIKVTDTITSWGRSHECTVKYPHSGEIRVPKTAFKLMLFETDTSRAERKTQASTEEENRSFYISTKATAGIMINDFPLDSYNPKDPGGYSRFWGELRHGDIVTVWRDDHQNTRVTRFKFECYYGRSKYPRKEGEEFELTTSLKFRAELEDACIKQERSILRELAKANADQRKLVEALNNNKENDVERKMDPAMKFKSSPCTQSTD
jgi:serine/threonine protein kinase